MNDTTTTMHFKIIRGDEKRRIELPTPLAFTELRETIATLFSDASTTVAPASIDITLAALNIWKPLKNDKDPRARCATTARPTSRCACTSPWRTRWPRARRTRPRTVPAVPIDITPRPTSSRAV